MTDPKNISIRDYTYSLPEERIARYPLTERDASKLLIWKDGRIEEDTYRNIANHIPPGSLLVLNNTKVVEARLLFQKATGGMIEIFCLEPHEQYPDITTAMLQQGKVWWHCLVGGASKWKPGQVLEKVFTHRHQNITLQARYVEKKTGSFILELFWQPAGLSFAELLHETGAMPLPPYIKRAAEESDKERYQTVYAHTDGSVAAPTAGLHFTNHIFTALKEKKIQTAFVTLHVGAGTFKPVKTDTLQQHEMHAEWIDVPAELVSTLIDHPGNSIIPVGTTSLRTLESLYWLGVKCAVQGTADRHSLQLLQWEAYELSKYDIPVKEALQSLLHRLKERKQDRLVTKTQLLIAPGYPYKIAEALVTNFHQPQSTLLLLVAALIGKDWQNVYAHALQHDFRFLSYGDGCLLWRKKAGTDR
ncbi:MAG: S-adenosylmethionine:tRNA ribosyltransferase-isomerase [Chitinophagaceae bacterium]